MNTATTTNNSTRDVWREATLDNGQRVLIMTANLDAFGDVRNYNAVNLDTDGGVLWGARSYEVSTYRVEFDATPSRWARIKANETVRIIAWGVLAFTICSVTTLAMFGALTLVSSPIAAVAVMVAVTGAGVASLTWLGNR